MTLSQVATHNLLSALFSTLSQQGPLILLFHDHRSDIKSLSQLGLPTSTYIHSLSPSPLLPHQVRILDTQSLYSGWKKEKGQVNLAKCLETVGVELDSDGIRVDQGSGRGRKWRAHNAGNDAVATLCLFEGMMERGRNHD